MGTSGHILTNIETYDPIKCIKDVKLAIINAGLYTKNDVFTHKLDNNFVYYDINIFDKTAFYSDENDYLNLGEEIILNIDSIDTAEKDNWTTNNDNINKLYRVIYLDHISDNETIAFKFVYEFLKLNPNNCLWTEYDWVYTLSDMEKLKQRPFDPDWCYKDPRNL